ncbi:hypothetical protein C6503_22365 [Candidatus Poribacteria bacterium]|nr:MAG: hypothetical protein C6503_22365 [Candidatus Poribacteria bacterium]
MGHERMSVLPQTKKWRDIFEQIAGRHVSDTEIEDITQKTIQNVRSRFRHIERDSGVLGTFQFLVNLAVASREENPQVWLLDIGIELPNNPTPLSFAKAVNAYVASQKDSFEYSGIAQKAASEAISIWYDQNHVNSLSLLDSLKDPFEVWRKAGNGAGFCELSRLFFGKFTQGYLEYFLEREISAALGSIDERIKFGQYLEKHIDAISSNAFETAKITQSFAAGWFNQHTKKGIPSKKEVQGFLWHAFGKMREELQRESSKK